jgi:Asp/Glu/Hydantoin racemase
MPLPEPAIAVLHTSPATIEIFGRLLRERLPGRRLINILDDSILPELRDNGGDISAVLPRWHAYARIARDQGAGVILNACSSIGALCAPVEADLGVTVMRVDSAMARQAVMRGSRIAAVATLKTTLRPTCELLEETARTAGRTPVIEPVLVEGAYEALVAGDKARHDDLLAVALERAAKRSDVVVLAQASMARVLPRLPAFGQGKFLVSPPLAVEDLVTTVQSADRRSN